MSLLFEGFAGGVLPGVIAGAGGGAATASQRALFGVLGASRQRQNMTFIDTANYVRTFTNSCGHLSYAEFLDPRIDFVSFTDQAARAYDRPRAPMVFANDGQTMTDMKARIPAILSAAASAQARGQALWILFDPSVGNIGSDTDTVYVSKAQEIIGLIRPALRATGGDVVYMELVDRGVEAGGFWIDGGSGHTSALNVTTQLKNWCGAQSPAINVLLTRDLVMTTNGNGTPVPRAEYVRGPTDTTHFTPLWGRRIGRRLAAIIAANIAAPPPFDPSTAGNLVTNYAMAGSVPATGTNVSGTVPTGYTNSRAGNTDALIAFAPETRNGVPGLKMTVNRSTMPASGVAEISTVTVPRSALTNANWYISRAAGQLAAADGVRAAYLTFKDNLGQENYSRSLTSVNAGGTPSVGTDALFQDTDAATGVWETEPLASASLAAATMEISLSYDKGTTGNIELWVAAPELRQVNDPHELEYDITNVAAAAITTNAAQTIAENTVLALQLAANDYGTWSVATSTDQASFSIDALGVVRCIASQASPPGSFDFEDAHGPTYNVSFTLTPFNPAKAAVTKAFTWTVTDIADGNTDPMTNQFAAGTPVENNSALWTLQSGAASGGTYTGGNNGIGIGSAAASYLFKQDGNTVEQRLQFRLTTANTSNGNVDVLKLDAANYIAVGGWATKTLTIRKTIAGANTALTFAVPADYKNFAVGDIPTLNIRNISGVYTLEAWLNGVSLTVATGSADVTALVTGGGALATARQAGFSARGSAVPNYIRGFHNEAVTSVFPSLDYLKALTWVGGSTTYNATSGTDAKDLANRTGLSNISLGVINPAPTAGNFLADGTTIRAQGVPSGSYTVPVIEAQTDGSVATPTSRTNNLTWIVP